MYALNGFEIITNMGNYYILIMRILLLFLTPLLFVLIVQTTDAQTGIVFEVTTDKSQYAVGEDVSITIKAINKSTVSEKLSFSSSQQADYVVDGKYRQSAYQFFAQALTSVEIPGNSSYQWKFVHKSADYQLEAGNHNILGEVVGYGGASIQITVGTIAPPEQNLYFEVLTDKTTYIQNENILITIKV